jgi:hypothetical protein
MHLCNVLVIAPIPAVVGIAACDSSNKTGSAASAPAQTVTYPATSIASPSTATALKPAFVARANAVCVRAKTRIDAHCQFPYQNFDALNPDVKLLPKIGTFFAQSQSVSDRVPTELRQLGTPRQAQTQWSEMLTLTREDRAIADRQITAAKASNAAGFVATVNAIHATDTKSGARASERLLGILALQSDLLSRLSPPQRPEATSRRRSRHGYGHDMREAPCYGAFGMGDTGLELATGPRLTRTGPSYLR